MGNAPKKDAGSEGRDTDVPLSLVATIVELDSWLSDD
jgi:hypothetical protein